MALVGLCAGCAGPVRGLYPPSPTDSTRTVYVVSHGWHTGIVVNRADVPPSTWPENNDFPQSRRLEVGWGDAAFYPSPHPTLWITLKAAFWPTPSVLHVAGFQEPVEQFFPNARIIRVELSEQGMKKLCAFIEKTYTRDAQGKTTVVSPGLYGDSRFYKAKGKFYLPKTCNTWVARGLRSAGCPITPLYSVTAGNLMYQTRKFGKEVRVDTK